LFPYSLFFAIPALSVAVVFTCLGTIKEQQCGDIG
jgi:hypothetical protein